MIRSAPTCREREVIKKAAQWLALLESGKACDKDHVQLHAGAMTTAAMSMPGKKLSSCASASMGCL